MFEDPLFRETLVVRLAFGDLVGRVCVAGTRPDDVPLATVRDGLDDFGLDRYAGLLLANRLAETYEEAFALAVEVRADWLAQDRRPRTTQQAAGPDAARIEAAFARAEEPSWRTRLRSLVLGREAS